MWYILQDFTSGLLHDVGNEPLVASVLLLGVIGMALLLGPAQIVRERVPLWLAAILSVPTFLTIIFVGLIGMVYAFLGLMAAISTLGTELFFVAGIATSGLGLIALKCVDGFLSDRYLSSGRDYPGEGFVGWAKLFLGAWMIFCVVVLLHLGLGLPIKPPG